ncbi:hypothetical protein A3Q34_19265 [Colwellia sp. PAMC 20917]|jgi:hypothetical protein|uniref:S1/P1 nuclease n=1 Tax=unclassified Colwellia TaxID=196834 RepID=UPI00087CBC9A|nr:MULTISPECIES: S1/P1 nuclease [unclassified Colwellia]AOW78791.1 hypothetical protein A3Q34_19265 [Colwellia sp. PAMC 20917]MBA6251884.1 S1/P1 nuclease [Colwellia sp. MB3u-55]MBA6398371.1 S1/P1 nuclease [Colwellia sp. BRX10-4]
MINKSLMAVMVITLAHLPIKSAFALGPNGHRMVAKIAEDNLEPSAKKALMQLTDGAPLAQMANWSDNIRSDKKWDYAKPWHYISIDDDEVFDGLKRNEDGDILKALADFEKKLRDKKITKEEKWQALAFYIHFVGDIHQPLHVGRRDDLGGNKITVKWFGKPTKLHAVWDSSIIEHQKLSYTEYANFLNNQTPDTINLWQDTVYLDWAKESKSNRETVYDFPEDKELSYQYAYKNTPILNEQIAKAGFRLAGMLNDIFKE